MLTNLCICHVCQVAGKAQTGIRDGPLHPTPIVYEPFSLVIVNIVGPLPQTKKGFEYLLTLMCEATKYFEAVPLCKANAKSVVRAMIGF